ncbi:AAA family ATPase [Crocosphaera sp. XPORK-15E]|uniref:AAA family ATPase n=1 Tax=Crocosphaera sp. XPORK-15E TaxID=3110247 RepID=UPI002B20E654|nr:AAA family ATPase [Crocosphaera sp. XPORK-15E]MEA5533653.1 AAA family ATPase [Crocosphaera sp. XPORK-15E]
MFDFIPVASQILNIIVNLPKVIDTISNQAQKDARIAEILKQLKLAPIQGSDNVDIVYAYALVEYGVFKSQPILKLLAEYKIKDDFWAAYTNNNPLEFLQKVEIFLNNKPELKEEIRKANFELAVELEEFGEAFISCAKRTTAAKFKVKGDYPDWDLGVIPTEFRALIEEKTRLFCGRTFVFQAFDKFLQSKTKGYFTVVGDAGMGKSAIASKYVLSKKVPCFFNIFAEGRNKPEKFLGSIRQQLIKRYGLQNQDNADLQTLLQKASEKLSKGQQLIIVVDALDEVEQEGSGNLLDLPQNLPNGVYFLLTRRPYNQQTRRLTTSPDTTYKTLDLKEEEYQKFSEQDVKEYIGLFLQKDKENKDKLKKWLQERNINELTFIEEVAKKSENNFMYLRYVLPWIAEGKYSDLTLQGLPEGLQAYYEKHWEQMNMEEEANETKVKIFYILVARGDEISSKMIGDILDLDEYDVKLVLENKNWFEYITSRKDKTEDKIYYSIYHRSFLEFLQGKGKFDKGRRLFTEVNQKMAEYLRKEMTT